MKLWKLPIALMCIVGAILIVNLFPKEIVALILAGSMFLASVFFLMRN
jgi:hypothetical protein